MAKKILGLIGHPLTHSFSQKYFREKFLKENINDYEYLNFDIANIDALPVLLDTYPEILGLNVTIPYKEKVLKYADFLSDEVLKTGAANTLFINKNKKIAAYNTDIYGFTESLKPLLKPHHKKALILGTGGAAKAVAYALTRLQISFLLVSRSPKNNRQISYQDLSRDLIKDYTLIINTTPLGTFPHTGQFPSFPYDFVSSRHLFYDLVYNPPQSLFLQFASKKGATISNGLNMLHLQAEAAWQIWQSKSRW